MSESVSTLATLAGRSADVPNLKLLKAPEEGSTKKDYEDFIDKIYSFVTITWTGGHDIGLAIKNGELPEIQPPKDLSAEELKSQLKVRQWGREADT